MPFRDIHLCKDLVFMCADRHIIVIILLFALSDSIFSQADSSSRQVHFYGYTDAYYLYDFNNPPDHRRPDFIYSYNRHNETNINLAFLKCSYRSSDVRANVALMAGTYAEYNLAAEPALLKNIYEVYGGIKLSGSMNLWMDMGVFPSHIGFESAAGKDNWTVTRSILADNSPYYEAGVRVTYLSRNEKWNLTGLILNGWQRIRRVAGSHIPSFGHQLSYRPIPEVLLNSSSFIGSDSPDSLRQMRYFHNFYMQYRPEGKLGFIVGFDFGLETRKSDRSSIATWYCPVLIMQYIISPRFQFAARAEYYDDKSNTIISYNLPAGFAVYGYSANLDYKFSQNAVLRLEGKTYYSNQPVFLRDQIFTQWNPSLIVSFSFMLE